MNYSSIKKGPDFEVFWDLTSRISQALLHWAAETDGSTYSLVRHFREFRILTDTASILIVFVVEVDTIYGKSMVNIWI